MSCSVGEPNKRRERKWQLQTVFQFEDKLSRGMFLLLTCLSISMSTAAPWSCHQSLFKTSSGVFLLREDQYNSKIDGHKQLFRLITRLKQLSFSQTWRTPQKRSNLLTSSFRFCTRKDTWAMRRSILISLSSSSVCWRERDRFRGKKSSSSLAYWNCEELCVSVANAAFLLIYKPQRNRIVGVRVES